MFNRVCLFVSAMTLVSGLLMAQSNPAVGTWKLNLAKSKYSPGPGPKSSTQTVEAQGDGVKVSYEGVAADGSRFAYSLTTSYDGKESPVSGTGFPNGAETITIKRIDASTSEWTAKKAGKVVLAGRTAVSKDGKVTTITSKGTNEKGQPVTRKSVYEKQ